MEMDRKTSRPRGSRRSKVPENDSPVEESLLIRQRLRNLCELAIAIGQKKGLFVNYRKSETKEIEGGQNVANKGNIGDCDAAPVGQDKTGS
jgi:hypothetical protein